MNFSNILSEIERIDPEVFERTSARRSVIKNWMGKVTLATLPMALGSLFKKAYAGSNALTDIVGALNFALRLEYMERDFYEQALLASKPPNTNPPLIPSGLDYQAIYTISGHEHAHVQFLQDTITHIGGSVIGHPNTDFSGGGGTGTGPYAAVFSNFDIFLALAQGFEDMRPRLQGTDTCPYGG